MVNGVLLFESDAKIPTGATLADRPRSDHEMAWFDQASERQADHDKADEAVRKPVLTLACSWSFGAPQGSICFRRRSRQSERIGVQPADKIIRRVHDGFSCLPPAISWQARMFWGKRLAV
jgi:hypothetical protein